MRIMVNKTKAGKLTRRRRRGFSLIDFSLYSALAIIGVLALFILFRDGSDDRKITQLVSQVSQLVNGMERAYKGVPGYGPQGDLLPILVSSGDIPASATLNPNNSGGIDFVTLEFDINLDVTSEDGGALVGTQTIGQVQLSGVPERVCERFLETFVGFGNGASGSLRRVFIGIPNIPLADYSVRPINKLDRLEVAENCDESSPLGQIVTLQYF